jgi:hypothetical protein
MTLSARLFDGQNAEWELENDLYDAKVPFEKTGYDDYDWSIELYGVPADYRLSEEAQKILSEAGFVTCYVNHVDKWETHYTFTKTEKGADGEYVTTQKEIPIKGWRVSYPHKRGEEKGKIWVEEVVKSWPEEWFKTGYVTIKEEKNGKD